MRRGSVRGNMVCRVGVLSSEPAAPRGETSSAARAMACRTRCSFHAAVSGGDSPQSSSIAIASRALQGFDGTSLAARCPKQPWDLGSYGPFPVLGIHPFLPPVSRLATESLVWQSPLLFLAGRRLDLKIMITRGINLIIA